MTPSFELMAPLMFAGLIVVLLIGYPVAFSLSAVGLGFGFLAIQLGYFDFVLLQALPERERTVLLLTFYDDRSADAVGLELGLSTGNVRVVRHRGIDRLRKCMNLTEVAP